MSIEKLNEAIRMRGANHSRAREAIYTILLESSNVLNVLNISTLLADSYPKRVSQNTLYRHLNFFIDNNLVIVLQDNFKRAYYYLKENKCISFSVCPKCNDISKVNIFSNIEDIFKDAEYITIHKKCINCNS